MIILYILAFSLLWYFIGTFIYENHRMQVSLLVLGCFTSPMKLYKVLGYLIGFGVLILLGPFKWLQIAALPFIKFAKWIKKDLDEYHKMMDKYCEETH